MDNVELLMSFGLTRQEARVYILLLGEGALSDYVSCSPFRVPIARLAAAQAAIASK